MARSSLVLTVACACLLASAPAHAQVHSKAVVVTHRTTSRDFTLKVAEQMPEADYGFKLTPPQMSFGEQMAHLASDQANLLAPFINTKPAPPSKPASMSKKDVIAFVRQSFDQSIALVSKLTPAQIERGYPGFGPTPMTGLELLMFVLDHSTHHRASAEMYLRAKGITPAEYEF